MRPRTTVARPVEIMSKGTSMSIGVRDAHGDSRERGLQIGQVSLGVR